mgnify:FL=1
MREICNKEKIKISTHFPPSILVNVFVAAAVAAADDDDDDSDVGVVRFGRPRAPGFLIAVVNDDDDDVRWLIRSDWPFAHNVLNSSSLLIIIIITIGWLID